MEEVGREVKEVEKLGRRMKSRWRRLGMEEVGREEEE